MNVYIKIKHIKYRYGINCIQKERQGKELDEKEKSVHVLLNTNTFFCEVRRKHYKKWFRKNNKMSKNIPSFYSANRELNERSKGQNDGLVLIENIMNAASQLSCVSAFECS